MNFKTFQQRQSQQHLDSNASGQSFPERRQSNTININQLQFQIQEQENQSDIKEKSRDIEPSFIHQKSQSQKKKPEFDTNHTKNEPVEKNRKELIKDFLGNLPKTEQNTLQEELSKIQSLEQVKKQSEEFILKFNKKPVPAVEELIERIKKTKPVLYETNKQTMKGALKKKTARIIVSQQGARTQDGQDDLFKEVAQYLLSMEGLDKTVLGEYFGKNDKKVLKILHQYCSLLDFRKRNFDEALRDLLSKFRLPGQSQQIQRIIWEFSQSFYEQSKNAADNPDELFPLAYSIIMLATDAHNPKQEKKMSLEEFIKNTQRACTSTKEDYLKKIYVRIIEKKLQTSVSNWQLSYGRLKDMNPLQQLKNYESHVKELKEGLVMLKICRDNPKFPFTGQKQSKFVQRKIFLSQDLLRLSWVKDPRNGDEEARFILISDIIDLTLGIDPEMLKQKKVPIEFDSVFFTIKTHYRTLHLKAKNTKERSLLINYLRVVMIQKREQRIQEEEAYEKEIISNKAIEQTWNQDIFTHWDKYWDFSLKKPKRKSYFARGIEVLCGCFNQKQEDDENQEYEEHFDLGIPIKNNLLQTLWKYGLPPKGRRILWVQIIGNTLQLNDILIEDIRKRKVHSEKLRGYRINKMIFKEFLDKDEDLKQLCNQNPYKMRQIQEKVQKIEDVIYETTEYLLTIRPDLPHVKDLLLLSKVFYDVLKQDEQISNSKNLIDVDRFSTLKYRSQQITSQMLLKNNEIKRQSQDILHTDRKFISQKQVPQSIVNEKSIICIINLIHKHHFLAFYRGDKIGMRARFSLFEKLMEVNARSVLHHFQSIKLETKMFLVSWFLSVFASCFQGEFLWRIWDNYLLEQELYLFKVGISIVKYFEIQLKMATFSQSLDLLKKPFHISNALFFHILQNEVIVDPKLYIQQIQSIKYSKIKDSVNQIPLS